MGSYGVPLVFLESTLYWWGGLQEPTLCCTDAYTLLRELLYSTISCNLIIRCMCIVVSLVACLSLVSVRRVRNGLRLSSRCSVSRRFCVSGSEFHLLLLLPRPLARHPHTQTSDRECRRPLLRPQPLFHPPPLAQHSILWMELEQR